MVKEALVDRDVDLGHRVLEMLDDAKFTVPVALWIRRGEEGSWRLLLASPLYDRLGPGTANLKMVKTLWSSQQDWVTSPIQLESTRTPLIRDLRKKFGKTANVAGMRLGGQMIGDKWVDDAYVYRIR
jgi:hypothetical protein